MQREALLAVDIHDEVFCDNWVADGYDALRRAISHALTEKLWLHGEQKSEEAYRQMASADLQSNVAECRARGWFARQSPVEWQPCAADDEGAHEDLNRLSFFREQGYDGLYAA